MAKKEKKEREWTNTDYAKEAIRKFRNHSLFEKIRGCRLYISERIRGTSAPCSVNSNGEIYLNINFKRILHTDEWLYLIVHHYLHLAFGHFDAEKITGKNEPVDFMKFLFYENIWKLACNLYNMKFLSEMKIGKCPFVQQGFEVKNYSEKEIYDYLLEHEWNEAEKYQAEQISKWTDMVGLKNPLVHKNGNRATEEFVRALTYTAKETLGDIASAKDSLGCSERTKRVVEWFISHYPLLGAIASGFQVVEDYTLCQRKDVQIAAIDVENAIIYLNPAANLAEEELKFVMAHEFLHAGLLHHTRSNGRNSYIWNVACDYVINGWLVELQIGSMPEEILYDDKLKNKSAEEIYDILIQNLRDATKLATLRGYGKGDVLTSSECGNIDQRNGVNLDDFYKNALTQGLVYHEESKRGYLPAGLIQEIRALGMSPIAWDVELAKWFDEYFPAMEKKRSYARPSRRQSSTPEIPRPRVVNQENVENSRTFGVIIDTSGSMSVEILGKALGSIVSYAEAKDVALVRVIFCDAVAYDVGYVRPSDLVGRVQVKGRGGTRLQPAVDCLEKALDFPINGPILIITDGEIEQDIKIKYEHAFLIPKGKRLPFRARGNVFMMT